MGPITEQRQVPGPVVYGYLLLPSAGQARRAALGRALAGYCELHEFTLAAVFTDLVDTTMRAPGFTGLLDALCAGAGYGVVIPTQAHLGRGQAATDRLAALKGTGRRLMVIRTMLARASARAPR